MRATIGFHSSAEKSVGEYNLWHLAQLLSNNSFPSANSGVITVALVPEVAVGVDAVGVEDVVAFELDLQE